MDDSPNIDEDFIRQRAEGVTDADVRRAAAEREAIRKRFERPGPLGRFISDGELLMSLVGDYVNGSYRRAPYWVIAAVTMALLYVLNPLDIVPDVIPIAGQIDDVLVIGACLLLIEQELHEYKAWKLNEPSRDDGGDEE